MLAPCEVESTEKAAEDASTNTEKDEDRVVYGLVLGAVLGFEKDQFACACWIELFDDHGGCRGRRAREPLRAK